MDQINRFGASNSRHQENVLSLVDVQATESTKSGRDVGGAQLTEPQLSIHHTGKRKEAPQQL